MIGLNYAVLEMQSVPTLLSSKLFSSSHVNVTGQNPARIEATRAPEGLWGGGA